MWTPGISETMWRHLAIEADCGDANLMKPLFCIPLVTGACAIAVTLLAWILGGKQEDIGSAIGGVAGLNYRPQDFYVHFERSP